MLSLPGASQFSVVILSFNVQQVKLRNVKYVRSHHQSQFVVDRDLRETEIVKVVRMHRC